MKHLTLPEVKKMLEKANKERELSYEQKLALEHAQKFAALSESKSENLVKELRKHERITDLLAYKIADLLPTEPDDIRAVFAKERFAITDDDIKFIAERVNKYKE